MAIRDNESADLALAHSANLQREFPGIYADAADLRAWIALSLVAAELAAETVESADWIGEAAEHDPRAGFNMESD